MLWNPCFGVMFFAYIGMLEAKGFGKDRAIFVGASRTTCAEAGAAGVFNVLARTAHQADSQITDVACVVDGFGGGGRGDGGDGGDG